ncbi:MAG: Oxidoreductase, family [Myxococcaceae bacterium]|nr:Oxidoreductase, family [Myxococcaceae bacterium]
MSAQRKFTTPTFPDDWQMLPEGSVVDGSRATRDATDAADYVIIGSGAAGATAALHLATAGFSVILLEEGPWIRTRQFGADMLGAMKTMFREMGGMLTVGKAAFPVIQGRCVGGSTTINSAIAWRAPEKIIDAWDTDFGLDGTITNADLEQHYVELETSLSVKPVDDAILGIQNQLFNEATIKLGIRGERIQRYDAGCDASASCLTGCRTGKKLSMNITYVPQSLHKGARMYTSAKALKVESEYGRATAVQARLLAPGGPRLRVVARRGVIVAASAVQTPGILKRSGVKSDQVGKHFQVHLVSSLTAGYHQVVNMDQGATQGFNSTHYGESERFKTEVVSLPPELLAVRLPGVGPDLMRNLLDYRHALNWGVVVRAEAEGRIHPVLGTDVIAYSPTPTDMARIRRGLRKLSEMMFASGAKEIWPSVQGMPTMRSADELKAWDSASLDPKDYGLMASHLFGSARMGPDAKSSVVGLDFQVHGLRGLYVLDSSLFPTNLGINPQHTIMAVARLGAARIAELPLPSRG